MKNIVNKGLLSIAALLMVASCAEETFPTSVATSDQVATSSAGLEAAVAGITSTMSYPYSYAGSSNNYGFDLGYPGFLCVNDACIYDVIGTWEDASDYDWFSYWTQGTVLRPNSVVTPFVWRSAYNYIKACNDAIVMAQDALEAAENEIIAASIRQKLFAAKAIRAQLYLDLARYYEPLEAVTDPGSTYSIPDNIKGLTVPIIDENTTEESVRNTPRATREQMFDFILGELMEAESIMSDSPINNKTVPGIDVVYGIAARAYLWLGGFDSSNYAKAADYATKAIETTDCGVMSESDWLNTTTGFNTHNSAWMWYLPQSVMNISNLVNFIAWRTVEATWGYSSLISPGVSNKFYDSISDSDWRKHAFVGEDIDEWFEEYGHLTNFPADYYDYFVAPYTCFKFHPAAGEIDDWTKGNVTDIPLMRVEEMYLIAAEGYARSGDTGTAAQYLTAFVGTRDAEFTAPSSVDDICAEVLWQKRLEFWGEGVVFFDFKRLGTGLQTGYEGSNVLDGFGFDFVGRAPWWNFCIPESETYENTALLGLNNPDPTNALSPWGEEF